MTVTRLLQIATERERGSVAEALGRRSLSAKLKLSDFSLSMVPLAVFLLLDVLIYHSR